jgi:hypothetical protein
MRAWAGCAASISTPSPLRGRSFLCRSERIVYEVLGIKETPQTALDANAPTETLA